jgi:hypothetical protein
VGAAVRRLLPAALPAQLPQHGATRGRGEHELVERSAGDQAHVVQRPRPHVVHAAELPQPDGLEHHHRDRRDGRQERDERDAHRDVGDDRRHDGDRDGDAREGLQERLRQRVAGEQALAERRQPAPLALAQDLQEALVPARALLEQRPQGVRRLLARDEVRVVADRDPCAARRQPDAELAVLGQAVGVPAVGRAQHVGPDEHGVAAQRDEAVLLVQVQTAAEPEEVLQAVAQRVPARAEVDELDAALDDLRTRRPERAVDGTQQPPVDLVLGVEDADDLAAAQRERGVERLRLVLGDAVVDDDADPLRVELGRVVGDRRGLRVVVADDDDDLEQRVVEPLQLRQRRAEHGLLVARGHQQGERQRRQAGLAREPGGVVGRGIAPGVQHPPHRRRRDAEQRQRHQREQPREPGRHALGPSAPQPPSAVVRRSACPSATQAAP